jgi:hypothetical protein
LRQLRLTFINMLFRSGQTIISVYLERHHGNTNHRRLGPVTLNILIKPCGRGINDSSCIAGTLCWLPVALGNMLLNTDHCETRPSGLCELREP